MANRIIICVLFSALAAGNAASAANPDVLYERRNAVTVTAHALQNIDACIAAYRELVEKEGSPENVFKYIKALDFKYFSLAPGSGDKEAFEAALSMLDAYCAANPGCGELKHIRYLYMNMWGRYVDILDFSGRSHAVKIKEHGEWLRENAPEFENYAASLTLGRLHYRAPNIIFILTWPDKRKSREYLEEFLRHNPDSFAGRFFLADTLWAVNERGAAKGFYGAVMNEPPRGEYYFEDLRIKKDCKRRVAQLGINY